MIIQPSTKDCNISSNNPTQNETTMVVGLNVVFYLRRSYIAFDISNKPSTINNATMWIYVYNTNGTANRTHKARRITSSWNETDPTWNNKPSVTDTNATTQNVSGNNGWIGFDVKNMLNDQSGNELGFEIRDDNESSAANLYIYYASREYNADVTKRPILEINGYYVKTTGNDALTGNSWTNAWATINKAATTVADGSTVHIGFGNYLSEPASNKIAPQNAGVAGIKYLCETAGSSGGVGTVKVEKNN